MANQVGLLQRDKYSMDMGHRITESHRLHRCTSLAVKGPSMLLDGLAAARTEFDEELRSEWGLIEDSEEEWEEWNSSNNQDDDLYLTDGDHEDEIAFRLWPDMQGFSRKYEPSVLSLASDNDSIIQDPYTSRSEGSPFSIDDGIDGSLDQEQRSCVVFCDEVCPPPMSLLDDVQRALSTSRQSLMPILVLESEEELGKGMEDTTKAEQQVPVGIECEFDDDLESSRTWDEVCFFDQLDDPLGWGVERRFGTSNGVIEWDEVEEEDLVLE